MSFLAYIKDKIVTILLFAAFLFLLILFLQSTGYPWNNCILVLLFISFSGFLFFLIDFGKKKKYFGEVERQLAQLDKPYLLGEVMEESPCLTDRLYRRIIRTSNRSVVETVHALEQDKKEYQEYVEGWVHEAKAPLTAMNLMCARKLANEEGDAAFFRKLLLELETMESAVDQALFFARSDEVYRDYMICQINLLGVVTEAIAKNRRFLTACRMEIEVDILPETIVFSDGKWLEFLLSQILRNCGQYRRGERGRITVRAEEREKRVELSVRDDGVGIPKEELSRIFEKGFTGTNGRTRRKSTGMGLYLCRKLCKKLGMRIDAESEEGSYTRIFLEIPLEKEIQMYAECS